MADINITDIIKDLGVDIACELQKLYAGMSVYIVAKPHQIILEYYEQGVSPSEIANRTNTSKRVVEKIITDRKYYDSTK